MNQKLFVILYLYLWNEVHAYENVTDEKLQHEKLKIFLANHLQIMYREGKLRWPKYRKEIENNYIVNEVVRLHMPGSGDI